MEVQEVPVEVAEQELVDQVEQVIPLQLVQHKELMVVKDFGQVVHTVKKVVVAVELQLQVHKQDQDQAVQHLEETEQQVQLMDHQLQDLVAVVAVTQELLQHQVQVEQVAVAVEDVLVPVHQEQLILAAVAVELVVTIHLLVQVVVE
tara:strand:- start:43 stop:483 length:441 start_codon:yes stop_codon:yes gene_type:complete